MLDVDGRIEDDSAVIKIAVNDTGIGINQEKLDRIFEKFSQVDESATRRHEGTGLGLAIASSLVELMGGQIGVESELGKGSTFWFEVTLPTFGSAVKKRQIPMDVTGSRILVVDDNAVNRSILVENMIAWKFESAAASSGAEALAAIRAMKEQGIEPDCVILDYHMPKMDGGELARAIRSEEAIADIPIIMLTSVDQMEDGQNFSSLGIQGHLVKPARSSLLLETIVSTLQEARDSDNEIVAGVAMAKQIGTNDLIGESRTHASSIADIIGETETEAVSAQLETSEEMAETEAAEKPSDEAATRPAPLDVRETSTKTSSLSDLRDLVRKNNTEVEAIQRRESSDSLAGIQKSSVLSAIDEMREISKDEIDVLIAEDNEVNQVVFKQIMQGTNYSFMIANNGQEAVALYRKHKPRVICMDVSMPIMNGHQATREIRDIEQSSERHTPIIGVTAHAIKGDMEKCFEAVWTTTCQSQFLQNAWKKKYTSGSVRTRTWWLRFVCFKFKTKTCFTGLIQTSFF